MITLPETWNVGFFPKENLAELSDKDGARVKETFSRLASELNVNIVAGSVSNVRDGKIYNTAFVFDRKGTCVAEYDKTHLFSPSGEHEYFQSGDHTVRFELDGVPCGLIICYDVRFPELIRTITVQGIDVLFGRGPVALSAPLPLAGAEPGTGHREPVLCSLHQFLRHRWRNQERRLLRPSTTPGANWSAAAALMR